VSEDTELLPAEYRHEVVGKFVKDFLEGRIKLYMPSTEKDVERLAIVIDEITRLMTEYCSGKYHGEQLSQLEQQIFKVLTVLRGYKLVEDQKVNISAIEQEIKRIDARIDSTNKLLKEILAVLKELLKRLGV
jgi:hypothetical protein